MCGIVCLFDAKQKTESLRPQVLEMSKKIRPVILAGGSGTRLWPLSRKQSPKQFLKLGSTNYTLLQNTVLRLKNLECDQPILICNEEHRFIAAEQMREIGIDATIILEPEGKNTAPAIALAALLLTMVTISFQAIKAGLTNPVKSLRTE